VFILGSIVEHVIYVSCVVKRILTRLGHTKTPSPCSGFNQQMFSETEFSNVIDGLEWMVVLL